MHPIQIGEHTLGRLMGHNGRFLFHPFPKFFAGLKVRNIFFRNVNWLANIRIAPIVFGSVIEAEATKAT